MDHPNVVKVFDAGADDRGRPYFVMGYVKGVPITEYCDRERLTTRERLELFLQVCDGVQHAHQKGIVHRDIKPSNVLVHVTDGERVPKIIDFGVAKATQQRLTERTFFTELGVLIGTPEYMSPEQAEMTVEDIDTRTDVYSLGVLLYELLVGALPFDPKELREAGFDEIRRRIREEEPSKPSARISTSGEGLTDAARRRRTDPRSLTRQLRGDLDWITMKLLEKDRTRRYGSPSELAADLVRHLRHEPVLAGPPSPVYRMRKLVRRHRVVVASVLAIFVVLVAGVTVSVSLALSEARQRREADRQRAAAVRQSYIANLTAANMSLRMLQPKEAKSLLDACDPALRGWEWRHLSRQADESEALLVGPAGAGSVRGFVPGREEIGSWSEEHGLTIWDANTGQRVGAVSIGGGELPHDLAISPGLELLATLSRDGVVRVWDVQADRLISSFTVAKDEESVSYRLLGFSADGELIILLQPGVKSWRWYAPFTVSIRDIRSGEPLREFTGPGRSRMTLSPDGGRIAWANAEGISIRDTRTGEAVQQLRGQVPGKLKFHGDGARLFAQIGNSSTQLWDLSTATVIQTFQGPEATVLDFDLSPDGKMLVTGSSDKTVRVWDVASGR